MATISIVRVSGGYRVRQTVTPAGLYIEWSGLYITEKGAQLAVERILHLPKGTFRTETQGDES